METFFAWIDPTEDFNPCLHKRKDLDIFSLTLEQREGEVAFAILTVKQPTSFSKKHALITYGDQLIFRGRIVGMPLYRDKDLIEIQLTAEPEDAAEQLRALSQTLKIPPYWDELFIDPFHLDNPAETLEARTAFFSWDRCTGQVKLSDLFEGQHSLVLTEKQVFRDSLRVRFTTPPLESIQVQVTCEWLQWIEGEADLAPLIARTFSRGMMNTLTPKSLKKFWPKPYTPLGRSGYTILESDLTEVAPSYTGSLDIYPSVTPPFSVLEDNKPVLKRIRQHWFRARLVVGWFYKQKRREIATFILNHKTAFGVVGEKRTLKLTLQASGDNTRASFFHTDRGRQAIIHAIEIARCHLASSARCLEIDLIIPFDQGLTLTTDHSIILQVSQFPPLKGKLIAYRLTRENNTAWIKIAVAIGIQQTKTKQTPHGNYVHDDYADLGPQDTYCTPSGIHFKDYSDQAPRDGILCPLSERDLIENLYIKADGATQVAWLLANQYPLRDNPLPFLEPTQFRLDLKDLQTQDVLEHTLPIEILDPWSAPQQGD